MAEMYSEELMEIVLVSLGYSLKMYLFHKKKIFKNIEISKKKGK